MNVVKPLSNRCRAVVESLSSSLSSRCRAVVEPLSSRCRAVVESVVEPLSSRSRTVVEPLSNHCRVVVEPLSSRCRAVVEPMSNRWRAVFDSMSIRCRAVVEPLSSRCRAVVKSLSTCIFFLSGRHSSGFIERTKQFSLHWNCWPRRVSEISDIQVGTLSQKTLFSKFQFNYPFGIVISCFLKSSHPICFLESNKTHLYRTPSIVSIQYIMR